MRIYLKRSGGFAGMQLQANLDTNMLSAEEEAAIEQLLTDVNFFEMPSEPAAAAGVDQFTYELRVVSGEEEHTICFTEEEAPLEMYSLFRHLTAVARRAPDSPENE